MQRTAPELVTQQLLDELHVISACDPDHMPREIELIEAFRQRHPTLPQVVCFDTAFHRTMPRIAKLLPSHAATTRKESSGTVSTVCPMPI